MKAVRIGTIFWPLTKIPSVSASDADPTTCCKVLHYFRIGTLGLTSEGLVGLVV